ncbi:MAG: hypothetical protein D3910_11230, partial [Candidatus Electrothrix sp. ATG2]|nr:hypothetical protein [Candidatus Electrothrix sp. ATG2]
TARCNAPGNGMTGKTRTEEQAMGYEEALRLIEEAKEKKGNSLCGRVLYSPAYQVCYVGPRGHICTPCVACLLKCLLYVERSARRGQGGAVGSNPKNRQKKTGQHAEQMPCEVTGRDLT